MHRNTVHVDTLYKCNVAWQLLRRSTTLYCMLYMYMKLCYVQYTWIYVCYIMNTLYKYRMVITVLVKVAQLQSLVLYHFGRTLFLLCLCPSKLAHVGSCTECATTLTLLQILIDPFLNYIFIDDCFTKSLYLNIFLQR